MTSRHSPRLRPQVHTSEEEAGMARRRSRRLHPQIHISEDGAGMDRRRSPRLHPHIGASGDGAGVTCRRSPRLHPQIHGNQEGTGLTGGTRRRRRALSVSAASLPDDDDMLREILLRLPPQPSSLPRASAVCKRWLGLVTDPKFHRQFRAHHRKPPLLGVFQGVYMGILFRSVLDPPDRIIDLHCGYILLLDCRHGLVLAKHLERKELFVCDPFTGEHRYLSVPPGFNFAFLTKGAVLCAASDIGSPSRPFKVVLLSMVSKPVARVYSSVTGEWGNLISTDAPFHLLFDAGVPARLVGSALYWLSTSDRILVFDLNEHSLTVIRGPPVTHDYSNFNRQIIQAEDGAVGFAILSYPHFQMWQRNVSCHGVATWVQWKTLEMDKILGLPPQIETEMKSIMGYCEQTDAVFIYVNASVYMVQLKSIQSKKLHETRDFNHYHPFTSFYTPGTIIAGGSSGAEILHNQ